MSLDRPLTPAWVVCAHGTSGGSHHVRWVSVRTNEGSGEQINKISPQDMKFSLHMRWVGRRTGEGSGEQINMLPS